MMSRILEALAAANPVPIAAQADPLADDSVRYYHGGVIGLRVGDLILPPVDTNAVSVSDSSAPDELRDLVHRVHRRDRVYLTTDVEAAKVFAAFYPLGSTRRGGDVYEAEPIGPLELDPDFLGRPGGSIAVPKARVVAVVRTRVWRSTSLGIPR